MGESAFREKILEIFNSNQVPYLDVIVYKDGKEKARFISDNATGKEVLQMYSMSKICTVVCTLRLIEKGLLNLDDKVEKFYPCFKDTFYIKDGKKVKNQTPITVWHLLTMTSGLDYDIFKPEIKAVQEKLGDEATVHDFIPAFIKAPLMFEPGTDFEYGVSHDVLLGIIEKVVNKPFCEHIKEELFIPLEMHTATFENNVDNVYPKYVCTVDKKIEKTDSSNIFILSKNYICGGAGLKCSLEDHAKLINALTNDGLSKNGYRVLEKATVDMLCTKQLNNEFVRRSFYWQGSDYGYGLGVRVREKESDLGLPIGEFGWDGACGQFWLSDRENRVSILVGMNVFSWANKFLGIHAKIVEAIYKNLDVKN